MNTLICTNCDICDIPLQMSCFLYKLHVVVACGNGYFDLIYELFGLWYLPIRVHMYQHLDSGYCLCNITRTVTCGKEGKKSRCFGY